MKCSFPRSLRCSALCLGLLVASVSVNAQDRILKPPQRPINLDKELEAPVQKDRAASYYHYSLSKWFEDQNDLVRALSEMRTALRYNPDSAAVHLELAALLEKTGNTKEAIEVAENAARLDPNDPDPHWLLANLYFRPQERGTPSDGMQKAIQELEKLQALAPEDARVYFALGGAYFQMNQPEKAIQSYEKFQRLVTNSDNGYLEIAKYYERTGNDDKAIEYLNKGLKVQPDSADSLLLLGSIYSKLNKGKEAIPVYKKLLEVPGVGTNPNVSRRLASLLLDANQPGEALKVLEEPAKNSPADPATQILRGRALAGVRKYPEAIQVLQSVIEQAPDALEARFYLARVYEETGKYAEAAKIFESLLTQSAGDPEETRNNHLVFQQHLAANYVEMGEQEKAIAVYQDMVKADAKKGNPQLLNAYRVSKQYDKALAFGKQLYEKDPGDIEISLIYGRTLADAGRPKEGAEVLTKLLQSNPDNIDIYVNLSQVYLQDKRYEDAERILRRAEAKTPGGEENEKVKIQLASVYERQKDFDRAESIFREILKVNPQNAVALNYIGYMLADRGIRLDEAVKYVKEALAIDPQNGAYLDSLGWAFFKLNDLAKAEEYLLEADRIVKDDATIDDHLGDLYFKTGDLEKAQEFWMSSVNIGTEPEEVQKVRRKLETVKEMLRKQKPRK